MLFGMSSPKQRPRLDRGQRRVAGSMYYEPQSLRRRVVADENIPPGHSVEQAFRPGEALTPGWGALSLLSL